VKSKGMFPVLCIVFLLLSSYAFSGQQAQSAPEYRVQQFYSWYLKKEDTQAFSVLDPKIYNFVCKGTVEKLRADYEHDKLEDVDYFTKVQDFDPKDWEANTVIAKAVITGSVASTSATFGSSDKVKVLVTLKQEAGVWKILKVESAQK
jgi:hypothetical protein